MEIHIIINEEVLFMGNAIMIEQVDTAVDYAHELAELLIKVVDDGASVGFLPPLSYEDAAAYWKSVLQTNIILFAAKIDGQIAGTVQLDLCTKQNGLHRAEIAKLMTHPDYRRKGIARLLMKAAEERLLLEKRSLVTLDTREGDPSNLLYSSLGFIEAGRIPMYAKSEDGTLQATVFYYKIYDI